MTARFLRQLALKTLTPVCALSLLAPAAARAGEEPETVAFVERVAPEELPLRVGSTRDDAHPVPAIVEQLSSALRAEGAPQPALYYRAIVDPARTPSGSVSFGNTSHGVLLNAEHLEHDTASYYVVAAHKDRDTHYGTNELLALIRDTAHAVANRFPGSRLALGNMSRAEGGDIYWSASHNSGRDADIAFFVRDAEGGRVEVPDLITMRRDGRARYHPGWHFDDERNWALVETLLTSQAARVQWIFVYDPIKRRLLDYARAHGADPELIARAERILHQPSDSARHDDHFHVRVYCSFDDRLEGCVDWGPRWPHVAFNDDALERRVRELLRGLMDPDPETVNACFSFLERLHPRPSAATIAAAIPHQTEAAQLVLLDLLESLGASDISGPLLPVAESGDSDDVRARIFELIGRLGDQSALPGLLGIMQRAGRDVGEIPIRVLAAQALRHLDVSEQFASLLPFVADEIPAVREAVLVALERTSGRVAPATIHREDGVTMLAWWRAWYDQHADWGSREWIRTAFVDAGYPVGDLDGDTDFRVLVDAIADAPPPLAYLADRLLNERTRYWTPLEDWSRDDRASYWRGKLARITRGAAAR